MHERDMYAPDITKAFAITLVVFGHVLLGLFSAGVIEKTPLWMAVYEAIYMFHMPLFFYLSGLFFEKSIERHGYVGTVKRNVLVLLCPLVIWSYVQMSLQFAAGSYSNSTLGLTQVLMAPLPPQQQFWFLGSLFIIMAVVGLVYKFKTPRTYIYALFGLFLFNFVFWFDMIEVMKSDKTVYFIGKTILNLPYFVMGIVINQKKMNARNVHPAICVLLFVTSIYAYMSISVMPSLVLGICSIVCILAIYHMTQHIADFLLKYSPLILKMICFAGMNTMIIYLAHIIVAGGVRAALLKMEVTDHGIHLILGTIAGMILPLFAVPVGMRLQDKFPKLACAILPVRTERRIS